VLIVENFAINILKNRPIAFLGLGILPCLSLIKSPKNSATHALFPKTPLSVLLKLSLPVSCACLWFFFVFVCCARF
jgi:hypothetical protein